MLSTPAALAHWNPHLLLEPAAFMVGGLLYWRGSNSNHSARLPDATSRWAVIAGAALGAAIGSRLLYVLEYWTALQAQPWTMWLGGKTLVGALLGGLAGVEVAKLASGWRHSTGDGFVTPLLVAMVIGRLGCQLSTVTDQTYGNPTTLPWAWDFGDAVPRHPTSLYEIIGLSGLAWLIQRARFTRQPGDRFRLFMVGYLLLRLALEFLKPPFGPTAVGALAPDRWGPLTAIQWACIAGLAYYFPTSRRWLTRAQGA
jgi:phosphatidylglycerol:prolipoprotein diacylglycerol transferase